MLISHELVDDIEREFATTTNIILTGHLDPIVTDNKEVNELKDKIVNAVQNLNSAFSIHDFRLVSGPTHTNLIFDIVLPVQDQGKEKEVKQKIYKKIKEINNNYYAVIEIDYSY